MGITETYRAWCFDEAVTTFGQACDSAMADARKIPKGSKSKKQPSEAILNGKAENALRKMLGMPQKFSDIRTAQGARAKAGESDG